ncbi:MAG: hypothetical protein SD837_21945 [Candidatus Electrothrix scaldis]|nr:MAG: hypothetical protein SD837_21945 [Candidatus Electrothrix sp. GW3-3]
MKIYPKIKQFVAKKKAPIIGAGALVVLGATQSQAALSPEAQAMVDAVTAAFADLVGAVSSMATANISVAIAIVVAALVIGYVYRAGRG